MPRFNVFKKTKQREFNNNIFGFDIETYSNKNKFYCASFWHENPKFRRTFFNIDDIMSYLKMKRFRDSYICATNLEFDFFGTLNKRPEMKNFRMLWSGGKLLSAKTYMNSKGFYHAKKQGKNRNYPIHFIDTLNYASLGVEKLGKIIKIPKLSKPKALGKLPKNQAEKDELVTYNMRDSEVSAKALHFLFDSFYKLGATPKLTIASTSMSLFKNQYLNDVYFTHDKRELLEQFNGYYGGRTECFIRGTFENLNYYDVNSLYPYVMKDFKYPNPNTKRITNKNTLKYINEYEGVSKITIYCPYMDYPLLPYRYGEKDNKKLIFPCGTFTGWYSHVEIRKAIELGYVVKKVHRTYYFRETCEPFKDFVKDMYNTRLKYKKENNSMEYVTKILMNSLYGKFGQKFLDKENTTPFNHTLEELHKLKFFERQGDFIRTREDCEPSAFCIPIWALYVTAYARLHLYKYIKTCEPIYCDTDSIITYKTLPESSKLGKMKFEDPIKKGIFIKPKMYGYVTNDNKECVKVKGLGCKITLKEFIGLEKNPKKTYQKFVKFKESLRRNLTVNEIIDMTKEFTLEDNKRKWGRPFRLDDQQYSKPITLYDETDSQTFPRKSSPICSPSLQR